MIKKIASIVSLLLAVAAVVFLFQKKWILANNPVSVLIQSIAVVLMIWARVTFGLRSFHAAANTTKGALITNGPYRWWRHPIYASLIYFFWASAISYHYLQVVLAVVIITICLFVRMLLEESFLVKRYAEYETYKSTTKRIIPFLI